MAASNERIKIKKEPTSWREAKNLKKYFMGLFLKAEKNIKKKAQEDDTFCQLLKTIFKREGGVLHLLHLAPCEYKKKGEEGYYLWWWLNLGSELTLYCFSAEPLGSPYSCEIYGKEYDIHPVVRDKIEAIIKELADPERVIKFFLKGV
ncbi:MAG: hypothetical protein Q8O83_01485 [bacterium]|nr:hypothetical protein [bacterium]